MHSQFLSSESFENIAQGNETKQAGSQIEKVRAYWIFGCIVLIREVKLKEF